MRKTSFERLAFQQKTLTVPDAIGGAIGGVRSRALEIRAGVK